MERKEYQNEGFLRDLLKTWGDILGLFNVTSPKKVRHSISSIPSNILWFSSAVENSRFSVPKFISKTRLILFRTTELDLLWNMEVACRRCVRASHCFDVISGTNQNLWAFTQNCYGGICIIHWCQVFGARSEPTHYSNLYEDALVSCISQEQIAERLRSTVEMTENEYTQLWNSLKKARDKFLVHNEFSSADRPSFPDLNLLVKVYLEMRDIICEIVTFEQSEDEKYRGDIKHFVSHYTDDTFLEEIKRELPRLE